MPTRTAPFILNKETGEPKELYPVQLGHRKVWKVIVSHPVEHNRGKRVHLYSEARQLRERFEQKFPQAQGYEITIVSTSRGYGPPYSKITDEQLRLTNEHGKLWCPYCRKLRAFDWDHNWLLDRCPVCRISIDDFHVRKNNPMFWDRTSKEVYA